MNLPPYFINISNDVEILQIIQNLLVYVHAELESLRIYYDTTVNAYYIHIIYCIRMQCSIYNIKKNKIINTVA